MTVYMQALRLHQQKGKIRRIAEKFKIMRKLAMKILLTGACGAVGYQTLKKLIATGNSVIALDLPVRKNHYRLHEFRTKARIVYGSINDKVLMANLIREVEAVIHLAAVIPPHADRNRELAKQVNEGGTAVIVDVIKKYNPSCFLLYASSISVYGDRLENYWIQVGDPLKPSEGDYYAVTKIHAEEIIRVAGIHFTIFRFTAIMGLPATDPLMFHMPLSTRLEIASTWDTAQALVTATTKQNMLDGQIFNLGGGPRCRTTYIEFLRRMFHIYGLRFRYLLKAAFAKKNFHCGWYLDTEVLDEILHFQNSNLEDYYIEVQKETKSIVRFFSKMFSRPIIYFLVKKSEPLLAQKTHDEKMMKQFFGSKNADIHSESNSKNESL